MMGDRPSSVGGEERSLSVGGDLGKKCKMLIYPSRNRRGAPRECVLELIGFPVSRSGSPQGSRRASRHLLEALRGRAGRPDRHPRPKSSPGGSTRVCFRIDWISSVAVRKPPKSLFAGGSTRVCFRIDWISSVALRDPGGNRETVFLSPPIRGQPRNGVSFSP